MITTELRDWGMYNELLPAKFLSVGKQWPPSSSGPVKLWWPGGPELDIWNDHPKDNRLEFLARRVVEDMQQQERAKKKLKKRGHQQERARRTSWTILWLQPVYKKDYFRGIKLLIHLWPANTQSLASSLTLWKITAGGTRLFLKIRAFLSF
jgi:hypothetical protein